MRHLLSIFSVALNIFQEAPHKVGQHEMRHPHSRQFYEEIRTPVMFGRGLPLVNSPTRSNMTSPQQYEWFVIIELTFGWSITIWSSCILNIPHIPLPDTPYEQKSDALLKFPPTIFNRQHISSWCAWDKMKSGIWYSQCFTLHGEIERQCTRG